MVHLDDIVIFLQMPDGHIEHPQPILISLKGSLGTLNLKKCRFFTNHIDYLRHVICPGCMEVFAHTIASIYGLEHQTSLTEIVSFLLACTVCRQFVPNFAWGANTLIRNLQKSPQQTFDEFSDEEPTALETVRMKLVEPPVLALPNLQGNYTIDTEVCHPKINRVQ